jgi:hypothetical protein
MACVWVASDLPERAEIDENVFKNIITGDETYGNIPETKQQLSRCKKSSSCKQHKQRHADYSLRLRCCCSPSDAPQDQTVNYISLYNGELSCDALSPKRPQKQEICW